MNPLLFQTIKFLKAARRLLNRKTGRRNKGWTQKTFARDKNRHGVASSSKAAVCFCMSGVINHLAKGREQEAEQARTQITKLVPLGQIVDFNDAKGRTQKEVVEVFTKAIRNLENNGVS